MGSKKQRAKATKTSNLPIIGNSSRNVTQEKILDRKPIKPGHVSPGNSPFMKKLPREIRDKIYEELLIVKMTPEMANSWDEEKGGAESYAGEYGREKAQDILDQDIGLMPGGSQNYGSRFIGKNKGILLANKQIYEEATTVLFGKNLFVVLPEFERIWCFWRCDSYGCQPVTTPCFVRPETAVKVKHLLIIVSNPCFDRDQAIEQAKSALNRNLQTVISILGEVKLKLKTLKIRYWSCFGGEVDSVRNELEGPAKPGFPERPVMLQRVGGRFTTIKRGEAEQRIFSDARQVLAPLREFKKVAEDVSVRGDVPQPLIDELSCVLAVDGAAMKKKLAKAEVAANTYEAAKTGLAEFARERLDVTPDTDPESRALYERMMRIPAKLPSVMAKYMQSPTKEEVDRYDRHWRAQAANAANAANTAAASVNHSSDDLGAQPHPVADGAPVAIGFIAGKPVFGPPRPPAGDGACGLHKGTFCVQGGESHL
ncbi:hypothetical protein M409DRAFT_48426 [Zasmidium cellare ATCC 36951]|uniref:Uncharacterized protein n=1 Tax=Zasmidium cellare ATCC 36951 TaxID=1080233 RepID=A0A6A6D5N1_ZASCE|nr:uncharacterized protein M409DRAFT_48426 [Zasmidium cellare ATCC 36951]KAF2173449.1 hypothetical protein M409DRAFT_48426 [Zasmidium cellare ATCC 36951]